MNSVQIVEIDYLNKVIDNAKQDCTWVKKLICNCTLIKKRINLSKPDLKTQKISNKIEFSLELNN